MVAGYFDQYELVFGHGTDNATDEAYWLVRHVQRWDESAWRMAPDRALVPRIEELATRRVVGRTPLAYLLGEAWFAGLAFKVDERVLIPRSPLAELIERCFAPWCSVHAGDRVLDIGTGSGCLAVAAAHHCPAVTVDATDISRDALAVARENVARHGLADRIRLLEADLFPDKGGPYRVIMSNPPYVADGVWRDLPAEYAHEPAPALRAGPSGLEVVDRILVAADRYLAPDGVLIVEVGDSAEALLRAYPRLPATWPEFERGGGGVFVMTAAELGEHLAELQR
jgi:ribosomal protein L3 glutamine methyltransferase